MKNLFLKAVPAMTFALLLTTVVSCNSKPQDEPEKPVTPVTLILFGGETVQTTSARRSVSTSTQLLIGTTDNNYAFNILSQAQIQLIRIKPAEGSTQDVTGKNYIFNHKN